MKKYFEMFGKVDFMMYRRTGIKENEPVIIFQMSNFDQVEEILYFTLVHGPIKFIFSRVHATL